MSQYRPGTRLYSSVCESEVMIIKYSGAAEIRCGGQAMSDVKNSPDAERSSMDENLAAGTLMGKRYVDESDSMELLCVKPGVGSLSCGDEPLREKETKRLPSSD